MTEDELNTALAELTSCPATTNTRPTRGQAHMTEDELNAASAATLVELAEVATAIAAMTQRLALRGLRPDQAEINALLARKRDLQTRIEAIQAERQRQATQ